jgi:hypothetical protein
MGDKTQTRNESEVGLPIDTRPVFYEAVQCGVVMIACNVANTEQSCWDPKDGELCLSRTKPEETLVEVRSGSDVQIDRQTWV